MSDVISQKPNQPRWRRILVRVGGFLILAYVIGAMLNYLAASLEKRKNPAGFGRGLLQGALMPMALPNLLVGHDVAIYSQNNTGVKYKLGFTVGVNGCGAIFFGFLYWRVSRWKPR